VREPAELGNISLSGEEYAFLKTHCDYLTADYLDFLKEFQLRPREQVKMSFTPQGVDDGSQDVIGEVDIAIEGAWVDTILYEIPILALTSEAYFRFMDTDWSYDGQEELAFGKGMKLLESGCITSEFGTRRRRDYHTQALVFRGLVNASKEAERRGFPGRLSGTSNVHLAMRFNIPPVGTVAHEWFMGTAAIIDDYATATEEALRRWVGCFGTKLAVALTDTFGTQEFLKAFSLPVRPVEGGFPAETFRRADGSMKTYAEVFTGTRQDSGDPAEYIKLLRRYYDDLGITEKKVIVFSDSLNIDRCLEYKKLSVDAGFQPTFGVGTFLTNDFKHLKTGTKSVPLNIVIKLSSAGGRPAVKIR
jgi:nicotinate phosphoribosyltransferase